MTLTLTSGKSTTVRVSPASVFIPGGATAPSSQPQVTGVNIGAATITASAPGYTPASQSVPVPATISFSPTSLTITQPGTSQKLLLALSHSAPWGQDGNLWGDGAGVTVQLSSSNPNVAAVPATVDLYPDGSSFTTVVVLVRGIASGTAVIRASAPPFIPEITATITVGSAGTRVPASITATGGTSQSAAVNNTFAAPLAVTVRDAAGNPVSGVVVTFTPPATGPGGSFAGGVNTALTNAAGVATSAAFTANSTAGTYSVLASVSGVSARAVFQMANTASSSGAISLPVNVSVGTNQSVTFPVSLTKSAPPGGVNVTLSSSDPSRVNITPATVFIAAGATTAAVQPRVGGVNFGSANITASAPGYSAATESVRVAAALAFAPSSVTIQGTNTENLTLTLSAPAPAGGLIVTLKSNRTTVATVPSAVTFGANATSVTVPVTASGVGAAVISATTTTPNVTPANAAVTVTTRSDITLASGVTVAPQTSTALPVTLSNPAAAGGVFVTLSSSDTSRVTVNPSSIYIAAGATAPYIQPQVTGLNFGTANVTAAAFGLAGDTETVRVAASLFGPASTTVTRGTTQNITLVLSAPTPAALSLALRSDNPTVAGVPSSATIPANGTSAIVPITGAGAGSTVIRISAAGIAERTLDVTVMAPGSITLPVVTVPLGQTVPFPVRLGTPAPSGGVTLTLTSSKSTTVRVSPPAYSFPPEPRRRLRSRKSPE